MSDERVKAPGLGWRAGSAEEAASVLAWKIGEEVDRTNVKAGGQFIERDDRRVALTTLKPADILLAETGPGSDLLLRQTLCLTQAGKVPADQPAHIHARSSQLTGGEFINYNM